MSLYLQLKYASLISNRLNKYKVVKQSPYLANYRCHYCGDSEHNPNKRRGYVFSYQGDLMVKCHNCGIALPFEKLLKDVAPDLYKDYRFENLKDIGQNQPPYVPDMAKFNKPRFTCCDQLKNLKKISQLDLDHPARQYVVDRKLPIDSHSRLLYCPRFNKWVNSIIPDKFNDDSLRRDEPRLIIPLIDEQGYAFGVQGRSFRTGEGVLRYITILWDETKPKIFGLDKVDFHKKFYLVEGPLDSLFLPNCLAMVGADVNENLIARKQNAVIIFDNQPRNVEVCRKIEKAIDDGFQVVMWPIFQEGKDINDIIKAGMTVEELLYIIDTSTYSGMKAKLVFSQWKRC